MASEGTCRECLQSFCRDCLVYAFGEGRAPFCVDCALANSADEVRLDQAAPIAPPT